MSLAKKAIFGAGWVLASNASTQAMAFLINVLLARLLLPQDFGSVAIISSFLAILQVLGEMGITVAMVQRKELSEDAKRNAFTLAFGSTFFISLFIWGAAPFIASFFGNNELKGLFSLAAFSYFFRGIYSFFNCLLLRSLKYKSIALINLAGVLGSGGISVIMAFKGAGAFAVVWGQVFSSALMLMLAWATSKHRVSFGWKISEIKQLLSFGLWVSLNRLLNNIAGKIDAVIIGRSIGPAELGQYFLSQRLVLVLPSMISGMIDQVLFPIYSRLQSDAERIEKGYWNSLLISSLLSVPPVCLIFLFAEDLVFLLYGGKWTDIVPLMRIMTIFAFAGSFGGGVFGSVMYSQGKTGGMVVVSFFRVLALPSCLLAGSLWGVEGVAWGFAIYGIVGRIFNQFVLRFLLGFSLVRYMFVIFTPFFSSLLATFIVRSMLSFLFDHAFTTWYFMQRFCWGSVLWFVIYLGIVFIFKKDDLIFLLKITKDGKLKLFSKPERKVENST